MSQETMPPLDDAGLNIANDEMEGRGLSEKHQSDAVAEFESKCGISKHDPDGQQTTDELMKDADENVSRALMKDEREELYEDIEKSHQLHREMIARIDAGEIVRREEWDELERQNLELLKRTKTHIRYQE
jgi:hypothetical protein